MATVDKHVAVEARERTRAGAPAPATSPGAAEGPTPVVYRADLYTLVFWLACAALLVFLHVTRQIEALLP